jgi:hypothetical protein
LRWGDVRYLDLVTVRSVTGVIALAGGHGAALGSWATVGVVAGASLAAFAAIGAAVAAVGARDGGRYRPGVSWEAEPEWFGGPADDSGDAGGVTGGVGGTW